MTRTKKTSTIAAALLGMLILMLTATGATAAPHHSKYKHGHYRRSRVRWSVVFGGTSRRISRRHYVPAHYVTDYRRVLVSPGHYETHTVQVLVSPGHFENVTTPAVTNTVTNADGSTNVVVVQPAKTTQVWIPDRYEMRETKVWIPARYTTVAYRRLVPGCWTY